MTNEVKTISDEASEILAKAFSEYKAAEARFKLLKDTYTKDISEGKHIAKYAIINKTTYVKEVVDYKKACEDNGIDLSEYTTEKEVTTTTVQPLTVDDEASKKSILNIFK